MAALKVLEDAAKLEFVAPTGELLCEDRICEKIAVAWNTPYDLTTLEVWLGPAKDGSFAVDVIGANMSRDATRYTWALPPTENSYHFRLQKSDQPNDCDACVAGSPTFRIQQSGNNQTPVQVSSTSSATSAPMASPTSTNGAIAVDTTSSSAAGSSSGLSHSAKVGIGVGVGLGVGAPILIALAILLSLFLQKRQRRRHQIQQINHVHQRRDELQKAVTASAPSGPERPPGTRESVGAKSWKTTTSSRTTKSYHGPFEFEEELGRVKPEWERLFARNGTSVSGVPVRSNSGRLVFRS